MTLLEIMNAEMKSRCPDDPRAAGNRDLRRCKRRSAAKVTIEGKRVRCRAYATKCARVGVGAPWATAVGMLGHAKRDVIWV